MMLRSYLRYCETAVKAGSCGREAEVFEERARLDDACIAIISRFEKGIVNHGKNSSQHEKISTLCG
jgi:hypothetical protein